MAADCLKVGELAKRTGVTVRTLHHYDAIGLLRPSLHTESGHRLYTAADVARLQQIVSLRQLGLSLEAIRDGLNGDRYSLLEVLRLHAATLRGQVERGRRLCERLEGIAARLSAAGDVSVEEFLTTIEETTMIEQYYTPEQLAELQERGRQFGEENIRQAEAEWMDIIAAIRAAKERGDDPASEPLRQIDRRCQELISAFTGGNPEIAASLKKMWHQETNIQGLDTSEMRGLMEYLARGRPAGAEPS